MKFQKCVNVKALNLIITAPENSPNTDGIHITESQNIHISNCVIKTGDDCISIVRWSKNIRATDITCGPSHGIRSLHHITLINPFHSLSIYFLSLSSNYLVIHWL
ncbi:Glycoside hydrolase [Parasponia andersonii]|uniref:Glycoside hydrolase n=1 Tax=Parasponia andersonii TaxID=3476 RepID=A0A2P5AKY4_PARAD|nr:Glycoside hydrolase [Parasponia andersonii]